MATFSPLSNSRTDRYGGPFENRVCLLMETVDPVREEWPRDLPLFFRLLLTDWVDGGWDLPESVELCRRLTARGDVDLLTAPAATMRASAFLSIRAIKGRSPSA